MKLDRDLNADGSGKYALIKLRNMPKNAGADRSDVQHALHILALHDMLDRGSVGTESEFFVMRLKDKFSYRGLMGYLKAIELESLVDEEYAQAILDMAKRSGPNSPFCKLPD